MTKNSEILIGLAKDCFIADVSNTGEFISLYNNAVEFLKSKDFRDGLREIYLGQDESWNDFDTKSVEITNMAWDLISEAANQVNLGGEDEIF